MSTSKNELLFEVNGFKVLKDATYVVRDKEDLDAPTGFIKAGVTKLPSDGVGESFQCRFVRKSATDGVWDTGFHIYSPCYSHLRSNEDKQKLVDILTENIVKQYEAASGKDGLLSHTNDDFWTRKSFEVYTGQAFNTSDPEDALTLYFALMTKQLTPKGQEGDSTYNQSAYVVVDITKDVKRKDEKASNKFKAIGVFESMLAKDRNELLSALSYLGVTVAEDIDDNAFRGVFNEHLNQKEDSENIDMFLSLVEDMKSETGKAKVAIYLKLNQAFRRNTKVSKNSNGVFFYEDDELGPDLKAAALNIARSKDLEHIKKDLLFEEVEDEN